MTTPTVLQATIEYADKRDQLQAKINELKQQDLENVKALASQVQPMVQDVCAKYRLAFEAKHGIRTDGENGFWNFYLLGEKLDSSYSQNHSIKLLEPELVGLLEMEVGCDNDCLGFFLKDEKGVQPSLSELFMLQVPDKHVFGGGLPKVESVPWRDIPLDDPELLEFKFHGPFSATLATAIEDLISRESEEESWENQIYLLLLCCLPVAFEDCPF